jgi:hypothetical protein
MRSYTDIIAGLFRGDLPLLASLRHRAVEILAGCDDHEADPLWLCWQLGAIQPALRHQLFRHPAFVVGLGRSRAVRLAVAVCRSLGLPVRRAGKPDLFADVRFLLAGCHNVATVREAYAHAVQAIARDQNRREEAES